VAQPRAAGPPVWIAAGLLGLAVLGAYGDSFGGAFVFDDRASIVDNPTFDHLGELGWLLATPGHGATAQGRPVLNLTLALNHAAGGTLVGGYHAANLLIHFLAGLTLFGVVARTLAQPRLRGRWGADARWLALAVAALWTVHPLQTESVTYVVQRAESLMGLFYLATLYCFIRGTESKKPTAWWTAATACCALGMGTKEVMVSAPALVLLYDRTFVAGTFADAWRRRRSLYLALAGTWIWLAVLVFSAGGNRGGSSGFGVPIPWPAYAATQFEAIGTYLRLSLWPSPLIFEYGPSWGEDPLAVLAWALPVAALAAATLVALRRAPALGFLGCWFFAILAPTSLVPGPTQMIVEHRMYLSLAAVLALLVAGTYRWLGRRSLLVWAAAAIALGALAARRNQDYQSAVTLWQDTVRKRPENPSAHYNLGYALAEQPARLPEAIAEFRAALRLNPSYWEAYGSLGNALACLPGGLPEAIEAYRAAVRINPGYADGYDNLGTALSSVPGRLSEAVAAYQAALRLEPGSAHVHYDLGTALADEPSRRAEAEAELRTALRIDPGYAEAHNNLGMLLAAAPERAAAAIAEYRAALKINPNYAEAHNNLANALAGQNRLVEAVAEFEAALRINPGFAQIHYNCGMVLLGLPDRSAEAIAHFQEALRLQPDFEPARRILSQLQSGRGDAKP
jgi:tetratricopeptide (TPR) repeat protein